VYTTDGKDRHLLALGPIAIVDTEEFKEFGSELEMLEYAHDEMLELVSWCQSALWALNAVIQKRVGIKEKEDI
jgi:hypothetical protein